MLNKTFKGNKDPFNYIVKYRYFGKKSFPLLYLHITYEITQIIQAFME